MRFLITLLFLLIPLTAFAQGQPDGAIAVSESASQDAAIELRLERILTELAGYEDVTVDVSSGIVTLTGTTVEAAKIEELASIASRVEGVVAIENDVTEDTDLARRIAPLTERFLDRLSQVIAFAPLILIALGVFIAVVLFGMLIARMGVWQRLAPNAFIAEIYRMVARLVFVVLGLVLALDILNATALLSTILGAAGIIGLAVGFAVRDTVENFIASIMLSIRQPFRPNDAVEIEGDEGLVIRLTSRATILLSFDGNHIRIPNATVFKSRIVNYTRNPERRFLFEIGVAPDADLAAIRHLAEDTVKALPFTLATPPALVWTNRIGDGAVILTVTGWIDQRETNLALARGEAIRKVKAAIENAGVEVPDTTYRVSILGAGLPSQTTGPRSHATPPPAPLSEPAAPGDDDVTTDPVQTLDLYVREERKDGARPDLLRQDAPEE
ncbi:MAG: mechanosensitive ion channel domain-containing protein [Shimia sp.]